MFTTIAWPKVLILMAAVLLLVTIFAQAQTPPPFVEQYFTQKLNHFDFNDQRTFQMRYLACDYYIGNTSSPKNMPVFVYTGNEGSIEEFYHSVGFMFEAAQKFHASVVFIEHRYYGKSIPFGVDDVKKLSESQLAYLSSEQALADFSTLLQSLYGNSNTRKRSIIAFGGSYGGILSAGLRIKYPSVVDGAIAASAPLMLFSGLADLNKFYDIVTESYKNATAYQCYSKATCDSIISDGLAGLSQVDNSNSVDAHNAHIFVKLIPILLTTVAQVNYPYPANTFSALPAFPVNYMCELLGKRMVSSNIQNNIAGNIASVFHVDVTYSTKKQQVDALLNACSDFFSYMLANDTDLNSIPYYSDSLGNFAWDYQACTEMVFPMANSASTSMFPTSQWTVDSHKKYCQGIFPNFTNMELRDTWASLYYGGQNGIMSASNIFLTHGQLDPWRSGEFSQKLADIDLPKSVKQELIEGGAHHLDLRFSTPQDPSSVVNVRNHEIQEITNWISEFNHKQQITSQFTNNVNSSPCPLQYRGNFTGIMAECALVRVALDPMKDESAVSTSETIQLFVKRFRASPNSIAPRALWLLPGGPGFASDGIEPFMPMLAQVTNGKYDIYTTEHRGVGRSTRIGCNYAQSETPGSEGGYTITDNEWPSCANGFKQDWGENFRHFTSKSGGIDMAKLIRKIHIEGQSNTNSATQVYIYGVSYGTAWITRFLRYCELYDPYLLSTVVKGVVLDGVVSTKDSSSTKRLLFSAWDSVAKEVSEKFLRYCNDPEIISKYDSLCSTKIKDDPVNFLHTVMDKVYATPSSCPDVVSVLPRDAMAALMNDLLVDQYPRLLIPAILYRMNRCDKTIDVPVLQRLRKYYDGIQNMLNLKTELPLNSDVLFYHLAFSEFWDKSLTLKDIQVDKKYILRSNTLKWFNIFKNSNWPTYTPDLDYYNQTFTTNSVQALLLNGDLDPQTPLWSATSQNENIGGNTHRLVTIKFANHGTLVKSPVMFCAILCTNQTYC